MIVYEILTNEWPFKNLSFLEYLTKIASGNRPEKPTTINFSYKTLIEKCWSQNPDDRPSFDEITKLLRNDKSFITDSIDKNEYENYINYIDDFTAIKMKIIDTVSSSLNENEQKTDFFNSDKKNKEIDVIEQENNDVSTHLFNLSNQSKPAYLPDPTFQNKFIYGFETPSQTKPAYLFEPVNQIHTQNINSKPRNLFNDEFEQNIKTKPKSSSLFDDDSDLKPKPQPNGLFDDEFEKNIKPINLSYQNEKQKTKINSLFGEDSMQMPKPTSLFGEELDQDIKSKPNMNSSFVNNLNHETKPNSLFGHLNQNKYESVDIPMSPYQNIPIDILESPYQLY